MTTGHWLPAGHWLTTGHCMSSVWWVHDHCQWLVKDDTQCWTTSSLSWSTRHVTLCVMWRITTTEQRSDDTQHIVISLSKVCDHDWSYTRHVMCTNNHCWPVQRSALPAWCHPMLSRLIFGPNAILGTSIIYYALCNVDFVNCDITVISSLKRFISHFLLPFAYFKEF